MGVRGSAVAKEKALLGRVCGGDGAECVCGEGKGLRLWIGVFARGGQRTRRWVPPPRGMNPPNIPRFPYAFNELLGEQFGETSRKKWNSLIPLAPHSRSRRNQSSGFVGGERSVF